MHARVRHEAGHPTPPTDPLEDAVHAQPAPTAPQPEGHPRRQHENLTCDVVVKAGTVAVILALEPQFSIDLQLIGGVLILQTLPPIVFGLLTRWFHPWALLCGWAAGLAGGLLMLYNTANPLTGKEHFGGAQYALAELGLDTKVTVYTGILALLANIAVTLIASLVLRSTGAARGVDETREHDYHVEAGDPEAKPLPATPEQAPAPAAG